jgi:hypothetical protein
MDKREVRLSKQLQEKGDLIEWVLQLKEGIGCQAKTGKIEDDMFACPDEMIQFLVLTHHVKGCIVMVFVWSRMVDGERACNVAVLILIIICCSLCVLNFFGDTLQACLAC